MDEMCWDKLFCVCVFCYSRIVEGCLFGWGIGCCEKCVVFCLDWDIWVEWIDWNWSFEGSGWYLCEIDIYKSIEVFVVGGFEV